MGSDTLLDLSVRWLLQGGLERIDSPVSTGIRPNGETTLCAQAAEIIYLFRGPSAPRAIEKSARPLKQMHPPNRYGTINESYALRLGLSFGSGGESGAISPTPPRIHESRKCVWPFLRTLKFRGRKIPPTDIKFRGA